jgi:hypothetical protein
MKKSIGFLIVILFFGVTVFGVSDKNDDGKIRITNNSVALWQFETDEFVQGISAPVFEINEKEIELLWNDKPFQTQQKLFNGIIETTYSGKVSGMKGLSMKLKVRIAPDNPVIRF